MQVVTPGGALQLPQAVSLFFDSGKDKFENSNHTGCLFTLGARISDVPFQKPITGMWAQSIAHDHFINVAIQYQITKGSLCSQLPAHPTSLELCPFKDTIS